MLLRLVALFFLSGSFAFAQETRSGESPPPNILLIVADDLGWGDVGWHGGHFKTPVMDELVSTGVELDRHYVQPVCSPTRTALLSGRWTGRFGPHALSPTNRRVFPQGTTTLASALKQCGYTTHLAGKWHLGSRPEWGPNHYGFDHSYGSLNGAVDPWTHKYRPGPYLDTWHRNGVIFEEEGNATELVAAEVKKWIETHAAPWFIYVPFHAVHIPIDAPAKYHQSYENVNFDPDPERNDSLRRMGSFVSQLDDQIGEFVRALNETGQRENTLIVFTSDNGGLASGGNPYVGNVAPTPVLSSNLPLRGFKNQLYEGGIRVPAFVNWPARLKPRKVDAPLHAVDWMKTLTGLAGWTGAASVNMEGIDAWPLLTGEQQAVVPRAIYIPHPKGSVVLYDDWKLIAPKGDHPPELYNLREDPYEKFDLARQQPDKIEQLQQILQEFQRDDLQTIPEDLRGIPN